MPYIANLENGRGDPTLSALQRLAGALGTRLSVRLLDEDETAVQPEADAATLALLDSPRARSVAGHAARASGHDVSAVLGNVRDALLALRAIKGDAVTERDLDRLLDAILLSGR